MKYDAHYHKNVVDNYRAGFKERFGHDCRLADAEIWRVCEEWFCVESDDGPTYEALLDKENEAMESQIRE